MNRDPWSPEGLMNELAGAITNLATYHREMQTFGEYYHKSAFYQRRAGQDTFRIPDNWLKIFADKNIHYTSGFPSFKIAGDPQDRENASIREKILYAVWRQSGGPLLQKRWSRDATKRTVAIAETGFDLKKRRAFVKRYDPRYCFWKVANGNDDTVTSFWAVFPITKQEAMDTYGVNPTKDVVHLNRAAITADPYLGNMDGQEWYTMYIKWTDTHRVAGIGNVLIEQPHEHGMGVIPVDICAPFPSDERGRLGHFYLDDLVPLQAELNDTVLRRSKIVKRMSNPIIWARGAKSQGYDEIKDALANGDSGVLGLSKDGEVGLLQLSELRMLDNHEAAIKNDMQRLSGFAAASFGESVGANTSGDALGLYFTPTQKHIDDQNISWVAFFESINAKILRMYDVFGRTGEEFTLDGYSPRSTLLGTSETGFSNTQPGNFAIKFTRDVIAGNYQNRVTMPTVIPKNENEEKRFWMEAANQKIISRNTAYEKFGLESPEDEKQQLMLEQSEPILNPDGIGSLMNALPQPGMPGALPTPVPPNLAAGVPSGA